MDIEETFSLWDEIQLFISLKNDFQIVWENKREHFQASGVLSAQVRKA